MVRGEASVMDLSNFTADQIASEADYSTKEEYESEISYYRKRNYTYIPMPEDDRYYHVQDEEVYPINEEQYIKPKTDLVSALSTLEQYPFLLIDWFHNLITDDLAAYIADRLDGADAAELASEVLEDPDKVRERYDDSELINDFIYAVKETTDKRYSIITLADVNKRRVRELLYRVLSEFEVVLSRLVEAEFPDSTSLFQDANAEAIGRWQKSKIDDLVVHISEYMYLTTLMKVVGKSESLRQRFGYESRNQFDKDLGGLIELRNQVMHPTKTLVHNSEDLSKTVKRLNRAIEALEEFHSDDVGSEFPLPESSKQPQYSD